MSRRPTTVSRRELLRLFAAATALAAVSGCGAAAAPTAVAGKAKAAGGEADAHAAEARKWWAASGGDVILKNKTFQALFDGLPNRMQAFQLKDTYLRCVDEGAPGGLHMAGSGCLYERAAEDLKGKITGIWTHEGCGAAKLYVETKKIQTDSPDSIADAEAKKLAERIGVPYLGRIPASEMKRPATLHDARTIYYDGTGKLEYTQVPGIPKGFMVSRKLISDPGYAKAEVEVCIGIAMGDHGFGHLFTGKTPLYICCVGGLDKESVPLKTMVEEMTAVASKFHNVEVQALVVNKELDKTVAQPIVKAADPSKDVAHAAEGGHGAAEAGHGAATAGHGAKGLRASFGPTYVIRDRVVNLADPGGRRYVRFSAGIEFEEHHDTAAAAAPAYDQAWSHLVTYTSEHPDRARADLVAYVPERDGYQPTTGGSKDADKAFQDGIKRYVPAIEDAVTTILSSKTYADVGTSEAREPVKAQIQERLNGILESTELHVTNVYFTEFVIQ
jgi:flagellar basal body-associated protein FliL